MHKLNTELVWAIQTSSTFKSVRKIQAYNWKAAVFRFLNPVKINSFNTFYIPRLLISPRTFRKEANIQLVRTRPMTC
ncbi:unnamed protein product [Rhizophagus irregularis]|uniref:Uncharacterized protein n=1 Tax=Rhizophagus irregularis TaxID=588596 RepID=A0A915Z8L2_9GLOM|nr:unnamed protein product [Rhizophagus irregularis]CAB5130252.1 unnamed protein product [Rhizophagus irregularis]CAB5366166.1 unnamed protein product [Rhizophagus irregularis]